MTARRAMIFYCVTVVVVALIAIGLSSCVTGGVSGPDATATYGAEQFHIQLTAQAQP